MTDNDRPSREQVYADQLTDDFARIVSQLRRIADGIERDAEILTDITRAGRYADLVSRVQSDILWGVANLNLGMLTTSAQQADEHRLKGE